MKGSAHSGFRKASSAEALAIGRDSPVIEDSSHRTFWVQIRRPSTGGISPGSRWRTSPTRISSTGIAAIWPERVTLTNR